MMAADIAIEPSDPVMLLEECFRRNFPELVLRVRHISRCLDAADAEDSVQDAILQAIRVWRREGAPTNAFAWLTHVSKNKSRDLIRKRRRWAPVALDHPAPEPSRTVINDRAGEELNCALHYCCHPSIAPLGRRSLALHLVMGLPVETVASTCGASASAIRKALSRAKRALRALNLKPGGCIRRDNEGLPAMLDCIALGLACASSLPDEESVPLAEQLLAAAEQLLRSRRRAIPSSQPQEAAGNSCPPPRRI